MIRSGYSYRYLPAILADQAVSGAATFSFSGSASFSAVGAATAEAAASFAGVASFSAVGDSSGGGGSVASFAGVASFNATGAATAEADASFAGVAAFNAVGENATPPEVEAFARGGFLPDDTERRERQRKRIRETIERVARPKQVAAQMREAVGIAAEPERPTLRDAVRPDTMEQLRRLAEGAAAAQRAREAEDDDEDVLLMVLA
jgi:hypothetical protein